MLRLNGVGKRYRNKWVLQSVDLELAATTLVLVRGANGSGKSTLLRIIAGLCEPSRGTVTGKPTRVAVVPDRFVPPRMTALAYLRHLAHIRGLNRSAADDRIGELAELLSIAPAVDVPLQVMSRGNAQKVALAQAFLAPVNLAILDEPSAALDEDAAAALRALVIETREAGATVVVADHGTAVADDATTYHLVDGRLERSLER